MPTAEKYRRSLRRGEIWLLHIKPGYAISTIECEFSYMELQDREDYTALSYTWGQAAPSISILVNGTVTTITDISTSRYYTFAREKSRKSG
ncbi:hypothetical protein BU25DRAFT_88619 [Macroventuria anomochaeta]|uniref:Uncharacterized protein n=1 Tax=Macroventuria anomochaeta TaxID=301207 RepID=A0ACB6SIF4_9PLEO|nr:uncharacterized protein BU25DRAFT_88619 [Macroventuria anomochaeta]KAF2633084.1 hypothetical protein BU25DRAFT_88619 [Macroventuria anomochaeta]